MPLSRRTFLRAVSVGAAAGSAAVMGVLGAARVVARRLGPPVLAPAATGELSAAQLRTLLAAAAAVAGAPIRQEHYAAFFRWRAAHLRGHRNLYVRFCAAVDRAAWSMQGAAFAYCQAGTQQRILERAFRARADAAVPGPWLRRVLEYDWHLYERYILREVLAVFAATDAWLLLGYDGWPGTPRGFVRYRRAPTRES
jgi:hypothetical protein